MLRVDLFCLVEIGLCLLGLPGGESLTGAVQIAPEGRILLQLHPGVVDQSLDLGVLLDGAFLALGDLNDLLIVALRNQIEDHRAQTAGRRGGGSRRRRRGLCRNDGIRVVERNLLEIAKIVQPVQIVEVGHA